MAMRTRLSHGHPLSFGPLSLITKRACGIDIQHTAIMVASEMSCRAGLSQGRVSAQKDIKGKGYGFEHFCQDDDVMPDHMLS